MVLHGARLDRHHMIDALEPVFDGVDGWQRTYVDLPGHGHSPSDPAWSSMDDILDAVEGFIAAAHGDAPVAILGESRGSVLAQGLAFRRAARLSGVALIVPGGNTPEAKATLPNHVTRVRPEGPEPTMTGAERTRYRRLVVQSQDILEKIRRTKIPALARCDADLEARVQDAFAFSFADAMSRATFDRPSLIVAGRQDAMAGHEEARDLLPLFARATLGVLDCAGHSLSWERPDLFKALVRDWLHRMETDRQAL